MTYSSFEEACEKSMKRKAVADIVVNYKGGPHRAEIVKPLHGDAQIHFRHTALPIRPATTAEIDSVKKWKAY